VSDQLDVEPALELDDMLVHEPQYWLLTGRG
jgi:hypothetical protein